MFCGDFRIKLSHGSSADFRLSADLKELSCKIINNFACKPYVALFSQVHRSDTEIKVWKNDLCHKAAWMVPHMDKQGKQALLE